MKRIIFQLRKDFFMLIDYIQDYRNYKKYNFGNFKNKGQSSLEAQIRRQTHILEKGMSLTNPRIGFGQEKIKQLFSYIDEYKELGYSDKSDAFKAAIGTLKAYTNYFSKKGYVNPELNSKIEQYTTAVDDKEYGIKEIRLEELKESLTKEFPTFFQSRYSVRQFADKSVPVSVIKQAVKLAMKSPSACNRQTAKVYLFTNDDINKKMGDLLIEGNTGFSSEVDKYLIITGDTSAFTDSYERNQCVIDASLFSMNLVLALHYYGVGSCILQASERRKTDRMRHKLLEIPAQEKIVLFIAIGYYKEEFQVAKSKRKNIDGYLIIK